MSTTEEKEDLLNFEEVDINIIPDLYVTWIVDVWKGDRRDPAVEVTRWIGVWHADDLEDEQGNAVDPQFKPGRWDDGAAPTIKPVHWEVLEHIKKADGPARTFKQQQENLLNPDSYAYGSRRSEKEAYIAFMDAIETLAEHPEDEAAWTAVERWRNLQATKYEK